jgi:hypothetical protein
MAPAISGVPKVTAPFVSDSSLALNSLYLGESETDAAPKVVSLEIGCFPPTAKSRRGDFPSAGEFGWSEERGGCSGVVLIFHTTPTIHLFSRVSPLRYCEICHKSVGFGAICDKPL